MARKKRKGLLTPTRLNRLCTGLRAGKLVRECAIENDISEQTIYHWLQQGQQAPPGTPYNLLFFAHKQGGEWLEQQVASFDKKRKELAKQLTELASQPDHTLLCLQDFATRSASGEITPDALIDFTVIIIREGLPALFSTTDLTDNQISADLSEHEIRMHAYLVGFLEAATAHYKEQLQHPITHN